MKSIRMKKITGFILSLIILTCMLSCIFSPKEGEKKENPPGKWQEPITPGIVIENLEVSFSNRDIDFYERCLHENYYYESPSESDSLNVSWSRSTDVRIVGYIFDDSISFVFTPSFFSLNKEYGINVADIPQGADISEEHPDEIWYKYNYDITMDVSFKTFGEYRVHQFMTFVMVEDSDGHWSIIRWIDETNISE